MVFQRTFRKVRERVISSYDINDLLQNRSYIKFYAGRTGTSGDTFSSMLFASTSVFVGSQTTFEVNFDTTVQTPITIQGETIIKLTYGTQGPGGAPVFSGVPRVRLIKYSGTESEILSVTFPTTPTVGTYTTQCMKATTPRTAFKTGDILRLEVLMTVSGSSNGTPGFFCDPEGKTTTLYEGARPSSPDDSKLYVLIPFVPNL